MKQNLNLSFASKYQNSDQTTTQINIIKKATRDGWCNNMTVFLRQPIQTKEMIGSREERQSFTLLYQKAALKKLYFRLFYFEIRLAFFWRDSEPKIIVFPVIVCNPDYVWRISKVRCFVATRWWQY